MLWHIRYCIVSLRRVHACASRCELGAGQAVYPAVGPLTAGTILSEFDCVGAAWNERDPLQAGALQARLGPLCKDTAAVRLESNRVRASAF